MPFAWKAGLLQNIEPYTAMIYFSCHWRFPKEVINEFKQQDFSHY